MFIIIPLGQYRNKYIKTEENFVTLIEPEIPLSQKENTITDGFYCRCIQFRPLWIPIFPFKKSNSGYLIVDSKKIFVCKYILKMFVKNKLTVLHISNLIKRDRNLKIQNSLNNSWYIILCNLRHITSIIIYVSIMFWITIFILINSKNLPSSNWSFTDILGLFNIGKHMNIILILTFIYSVFLPLYFCHIVWTKQINKKILLNIRP
jgi:hypothetical protein